MLQKLKNNILTREHDKSILVDYFFKKNDQPKPLVIFVMVIRDLKIGARGIW